MAIISRTGIIRGSIGNRVIQRGRYGCIIRARVTPTNPRTKDQKRQRKIFKRVNKLWPKLTDHQRLSWETAAKSVKTRAKRAHLTAREYFLSLNITRLTCGLKPIATPTAPPLFAPFKLLTPTLTDAALILSFRFLAPPPGIASLPEKLIVFATDSSEKINTTARKTRRFLGAFDPASPTLTQDIFDAYTARFGAPVVGKKAEFTFQQMTAGHKSLPITALLTVTPAPAPVKIPSPARRVLRRAVRLPQSRRAPLCRCRARDLTHRLRLLKLKTENSRLLPTHTIAFAAEKPHPGTTHVHYRKPNDARFSYRILSHINPGKDKLTLSFARLICKREPTHGIVTSRWRHLPNPLQASLTGDSPNDSLSTET
jgi:hypothetical protein